MVKKQTVLPPFFAKECWVYLSGGRGFCWTCCWLFLCTWDIVKPCCPGGLRFVFSFFLHLRHSNFTLRKFWSGEHRLWEVGPYRAFWALLKPWHCSEGNEIFPRLQRMCREGSSCSTVSKRLWWGVVEEQHLISVYCRSRGHVCGIRCAYFVVNILGWSSLGIF